MKEHITRFSRSKMMLISLLTSFAVCNLSCCVYHQTPSRSLCYCFSSAFSFCSSKKKGFCHDKHRSISVSNVIHVVPEKLFMTAIGWWRQSTEHFFSFNVPFFVVFNKTLLSNDVSLPSVHLRRDESRKAFHKKSFRTQANSKNRIFVHDVMNHPLSWKFPSRHFMLDFCAFIKAQLSRGTFERQLSSWSVTLLTFVTEFYSKC